MFFLYFNFQGCRGNGNSHKNVSGMGMGIVVILWEFLRGNPIGIPTWESHGNSHMGILWESYGNSHVGILWESCGILESCMSSHMGILWESYGNFMGIPTWESCGNSHRKPVGMGWEWELKFHSHGNPDNFTRLPILSKQLNSKVTKNHQFTPLLKLCTHT